MFPDIFTNLLRDNAFESYCHVPLKLYFYSVWGRKEEGSLEDIEEGKIRKKTEISD